MKTKLFLKSAVLLPVMIFLTGFSLQAGMYSRTQARKTIEQTSYIINEAYEIARYYSFWQTGNVSRAMYYNNYAQDLFFYHQYRNAIRYSLFARQYALDVIDNCDDYWEYFYYTYYGWSNRYGYNYGFSYANGYRDGYYDAYYARYCYRHNHDYRHDPYRNMQSDWYGQQRYDDVISGRYFTQTNSGTSFHRGTSGRTQSSANGNGVSRSANNTASGNTNGSLSGSGYRNIVSSNYFSQNEMALVNDIPSVETMERDFKSKNPSVTFSDETLSSKSDVIKRNTASSSNFISRSSNKQEASRINLQRPSEVNTENGNNDTENKEIKVIQRNNGVSNTTGNTSKRNTATSTSRDNTKVIINTNTQQSSKTTESNTVKRNTGVNSSNTRERNNAVNTGSTQRKTVTPSSNNSNSGREVKRSESRVSGSSVRKVTR